MIREPDNRVQYRYQEQGSCISPHEDEQDAREEIGPVEDRAKKLMGECCWGKGMNAHSGSARRSAHQELLEVVLDFGSNLRLEY